MRIAVVGAGVSGLVSAWILQRENEVVVFEAGARPGGHANTVDVAVAGQHHSVDVGFIVYNETTYPHFTEILRRLDVATQPSDMSFGVRCDRTGVEWASPNLSTVFAQRRNLLRPAFHRMLGDALRFHREARELVAFQEEKATLGEWLCGRGFSQEFVNLYAVPMGAAIWSADPSGILDFPAVSFARFFANHGLLERPSPIHWRTIEGGSRNYVEALAGQLRGGVQTHSPVDTIRRNAMGIEIVTRDGDAHAFDRVVLATHSDQSLRMLADPTALEQHILSSVRYQANELVLHTDASVLPRNPRARASWNYRIPEDRGRHVGVSYDMNRLQGIRSSEPLIVTLNPDESIDPARVLYEQTVQHPVFDRAAMSAQRLLERLPFENRTHLCGAWTGYGFHEDGARSAVTVARSLGLEL
jgi:predicted NAD/FAD-binding protein